MKNIIMNLRKEAEIIKYWPADSKPVVSVICTTYNQEKFIADAIKGFLIQITNFPFDIIIHDDASTDNTPKVIQEYEKQYSKIIRPIYQKENQYSKKISIWRDITFPLVSGNYIAVCEGDDYWTDPLKLQKQVDFLESNEEYSMCCTNFSVVDSNKKILQETGWSLTKTQPVITQEVVLRNYTPKTLTVLLRSKYVKSVINNQSFTEPPNGDTLLFSLITGYGPCYFINEITGCYRLNDNGVWSKKSISDQLQMRFKTLTILYQYFHGNSKFQTILSGRLSETARSLIINLFKEFRYLSFTRYLYYYLIFSYKAFKGKFLINRNPAEN